MLRGGGQKHGHADKRIIYGCRPGMSANAVIAMATGEQETNNICMYCESPSLYMICEKCTKKGNKMAVDLTGDQYIGDDSIREEPKLSEFSKAAINLKPKLHEQAEKPRDNSWKEIARCDNLYKDVLESGARITR